MISLLLGLLLWSGVHLLPAMAPLKRQMLQDKLGVLPYKGLFSLLIFASLALIVVGWRSIDPVQLYALPTVRPLALLLILLAFIIMAAAYVPSRLRKLLRHPQLSAVIIWAIAHLLLNGDSRSLLLFCGLLLWAVLEIIYINRREGKAMRAASPAWMMEIAVIAVGLAVYLVLAKAHPWLAGIKVL